MTSSFTAWTSGIQKTGLRSDTLILLRVGFKVSAKQWDRFSSLRSEAARSTPLCAFWRIFSVDKLTANSRRALNRTDIALAHSSIDQLVPRRARSLVGRID